MANLVSHSKHHQVTFYITTSDFLYTFYIDLLSLTLILIYKGIQKCNLRYTRYMVGIWLVY